MIVTLNVMSGIICALLVALVTTRGIVAELAYDSLSDARPDERRRRTDLAFGALLTVLCVALMACLTARIYAAIA